MKVQKMHDHKSKKPKTSQSQPQNRMTSNLKKLKAVNSTTRIVKIKLPPR